MSQNSVRPSSSNRLRFLVYGGVFTALATVLMFFEFPIIPAFPYLKIDLGDLPAAAAGVALGPLAAVAVEFLKALIHGVVTGGGGTMGFGDLINFVVGAALTAPFAAVLRAALRRGRNRFAAVLPAGIAGMAAMAAAGVVGNYLIAPPYFWFVMHVKLAGPALWAAIGSATILNVVKAAVVSLLMLPVLEALHATKLVPGRQTLPTRQNP